MFLILPNLEEMLEEEAPATPTDESQARQTNIANKEAQATFADKGGQEVKKTQKVIVLVDQEVTKT